MPPRVKEIIRLFVEAGFLYKNTEGDHHHFVDPHTGQKLTIAGNPSKEVTHGTWAKIQKQLRERKQ